MPNNKELGAYGEKLAADFLTGKGYGILESNYRGAGGEIDLIAGKDGCIIFVEVKFRNNLKFGYPREAVGYAKQRKIRKTAMMYLMSHKIRNMDLRFDVIEILSGGAAGETTIEHIENAF